MNILFFVGGFLIGAILVTIFFNINKKSSDSLMILYKNEFENMAHKIFEENSKNLSEDNKEKLNDIYTRFKEKIDEFKNINEKNINEQKEKFLIFDRNIKDFIGAGNKIAQDTNNLTKIMKSDNRSQGLWGEIVLEKVLENSGLRKDVEYYLQKGDTVSGRPDAEILLPDNKRIMIDAKTSLASFSAYIENEDDEEKKKYLEEFKNSTKKHIEGLAKRDYSLENVITPDYVLMFIPIESCYSLIFCDDSYLWDYAWKKKIMPVSPSTLLASLKIINSFLTTDRQNKNAQEISRLATKMLDKFSEMVKNLESARKSIDDGLTKLDGKDSIIVNANKMIELGATMNKSMPEIKE